jgi:hypothetical protein
MAWITAEHLIRHLAQASLVLMRREPGAARRRRHAVIDWVSMGTLPYYSNGQIIDAARDRRKWKRGGVRTALPSYWDSRCGVWLTTDAFVSYISNAIKSNFLHYSTS